MANREKIVSFLDQALCLDQPKLPPRVHVTLTFAQSLDARIAGVGGRQLMLSCEESMIMTHRLRSRHDAILVGIGTALNDDPQLNTRLLPSEDGGHDVPLPIVLDADLRLRPDCKLLSNFRANKGRQPTVFTANTKSEIDTGWCERRERLEAEGAKVILIPAMDGRLELPFLISNLDKLGIRSLMVEGGASVITSFLQSGLIDCLIVTVCPTIVGVGGIGYNVIGEVDGLEYLQSIAVGIDTVMAWRAVP
ncbi:hypothetical protein M0805_003774 [Coniferiporia weirii]|nr:hypothetical protein M0805_003774 [Coniferiporia weirii]